MNVQRFCFSGISRIIQGQRGLFSSGEWDHYNCDGMVAFLEVRQDIGFSDFRQSSDGYSSLVKVSKPRIHFFVEVYDFC